MPGLLPPVLVPWLVSVLIIFHNINNFPYNFQLQLPLVLLLGSPLELIWPSALELLLVLQISATPAFVMLLSGWGLVLARKYQ